MSTPSSSTLTIQNVQLADYGDYLVTMGNNIGTSNYTFSVVPKSKVLGSPFYFTLIYFFFLFYLSSVRSLSFFMFCNLLPLIIIFFTIFVLYILPSFFFLQMLLFL